MSIYKLSDELITNIEYLMQTVSSESVANRFVWKYYCLVSFATRDSESTYFSLNSDMRPISDLPRVIYQRDIKHISFDLQRKLLLLND